MSTRSACTLACVLRIAFWVMICSLNLQGYMETNATSFEQAGELAMALSCLGHPFLGVVSKGNQPLGVPHFETHPYGFVLFGVTLFAVLSKRKPKRKPAISGVPLQTRPCDWLSSENVPLVRASPELVLGVADHGVPCWLIPSMHGRVVSTNEIRGGHLERRQCPPGP